MKPAIRTAWTLDGNIEAAIFRPEVCPRVVIDTRTGNVIEANVKEGSDEFRWLVRAARDANQGRNDPTPGIATDWRHEAAEAMRLKR